MVINWVYIGSHHVITDTLLLCFLLLASRWDNSPRSSTMLLEKSAGWSIQSAKNSKPFRNSWKCYSELYLCRYLECIIKLLKLLQVYFFSFLQTCPLVNFHANFLSLAKTTNSDMLFRVADNFLIKRWCPQYFLFVPRPLLIFKMENKMMY